MGDVEFTQMNSSELGGPSSSVGCNRNPSEPVSEPMNMAHCKRQTNEIHNNIQMYARFDFMQPAKWDPPWSEVCFAGVSVANVCISDIIAIFNVSLSSIKQQKTMIDMDMY